jgi:hypothetical protein
LKTSTDTLVSVAQSTGLRGLGLCHWLVNIGALWSRCARDQLAGLRPAINARTEALKPTIDKLQHDGQPDAAKPRNAAFERLSTSPGGSAIGCRVIACLLDGALICGLNTSAPGRPMSQIKERRLYRVLSVPIGLPRRLERHFPVKTAVHGFTIAGVPVMLLLLCASAFCIDSFSNLAPYPVESYGVRLAARYRRLLRPS